MTRQHEHLLQLLAQGIQQLSLRVDERQQQQLIQLIYLLEKWNKVYNLTAIRVPHEMVVKHILDSLSILPSIESKLILDVGTGPGFPGLPLAICLVDKDFHLLDSNGKKLRFIQQAVQELAIDNVKVIHARVEAWQPEQAYQQIVVRAFAELAKVWRLCEHLLAEDGSMMAMKGHYPEQEIGELALDVVVNSETIDVPLLNSQRHLICLRRKLT